MKDFFIYLAGGMSKFGKNNYDESNGWRLYCKNHLENSFGDGFKIYVTNPNDYFNFCSDAPEFSSQREVMEFDLNRVRHSDLIIVNFNDPKSLGTMAEIAIAYERKIPVIGLNEFNNKLHPWQIEMCNRIFDDIQEMMDYVKNYYLS